MAFLCLDLFLSFTNRTYNFFQGISVQFRDRSVKYMSFEMGRYQPDEVGVSEEFAKSKKLSMGLRMVMTSLSAVLGRRLKM
jgi:hypothetical protein